MTTFVFFPGPARTHIVYRQFMRGDRVVIETQTKVLEHAFVHINTFLVCQQPIRIARVHSVEKKVARLFLLSLIGIVEQMM